MIGTNQTGAVIAGRTLHSALAVGVLGLEIYPPGKGQGDAEESSPEEKESHRWPRGFEQVAEAVPTLGDTEVVIVDDRESDLFELFDLRRRRERSVHLLIRAKHNRRLADQSQKLFDHLSGQPVAASAEVEIARQRATKGKPGRPGREAVAARTAEVELRWEKGRWLRPQAARTGTHSRWSFMPSMPGSRTPRKMPRPCTGGC